MARARKKKRAGWSTPRQPAHPRPPRPQAAPADRAPAVLTPAVVRQVVVLAPAPQEEFFRQWEADPVAPAAPPSGRPVLRRVAIGLVTAAALGAAVVVGVQLLDGSSTDDSPVRSATTASLPGTTTGGRDVGAPGTGVPGLTAPGVHVQAVPAASGDLDVIENVVFTGGATALELSLPSVKGVSPSARPGDDRITDLRVTADGAPVQTSTSALAEGGRLLLPNAPRAVELRYRLVGVVMVSRPSTAGRALVLLPPISTGDDLRRLPVVIEVRGGTVRNLFCPGLAAADQLCGRQDGGLWRSVSLGSGSTAVLAQLDLPTG